MTSTTIKKASVPKWFYAYLALALFDILTVSVSLYLNREIVSIYFTTVDNNREWAALKQNVADFGEKALAVNAPGNNVFDTLNVANESTVFEGAKKELNVSYEKVRNSLNSSKLISDPTHLLSLLSKAHDDFLMLETEVDFIFTEINNGSVDVAATHMSTMDRHYADLASAISKISAQLRMLQIIEIEEDVKTAEDLKVLELAIGVLIILMVIGATFYGNILIKGIKRDEKERHYKELELSTIFAAAIDPMIVVNEKGIVQSANLAVKTVLGYDPEELIGQNISIMVPSPHKENHDGYIKHYLKTREAKIVGSSREVTALHAHGYEVPVILSLSEMQFHNETRFVGTIHDISEQKERELALTQAKEEAERANELKSEFLANMSHEIRTPMNGIMGINRILSESNLSKEQKKYSDIIKSSSESLLTILNDILDFSKIEADKLELEYVDFNLVSLLEEIAELLSIKCQEKSVEVILRISSDTPAVLKCDPVRLRQIINNLSNNAFKFTETGSITISSELIAENDDHYDINISVADTGVGIEKHAQVGIFEKFSQEDASTTRKFGGTGLGLAISKKLVEMLGGNISVASEKNQGSVFSFNFTPEKSLNTALINQSEPKPDLSDINLLLVDDNKVGLKAYAQLLTSRGAKVSMAINAKQALQVIASKPLDVIILDYMMPDMDGLELCQNIRLSHPDMPIILLSSANVPREKLETIGFNGYLNKPVESLQVDRLIKLLLNQPRSKLLTYQQLLAMTGSAMKEQTTPKVSSSVKAQTRILLVDDNAINQMVAQEMLSQITDNITLANDGAEAFELFTQNDFDVVLMDVQMPILDGYAATQKIREYETNHQQQRTTIIALTANAMKSDIEQCEAAGMDDFISKPIDKDKLLDKIRQYSPSIMYDGGGI